MKQVLSKIEHDRDFELVVQWNSNPLANLKPLETIEFEQINLSSGACSATVPRVRYPSMTASNGSVRRRPSLAMTNGIVPNARHTKTL